MISSRRDERPTSCRFKANWYFWKAVSKKDLAICGIGAEENKKSPVEGSNASHQNKDKPDKGYIATYLCEYLDLLQQTSASVVVD